MHARYILRRRVSALSVILCFWGPVILTGCSLATPGSCAYGDWSSPAFVSALRFGGMLKEPEVVGQGASQFVIGNDIPILEVPTSHKPLAVIRLPDRSLSLPPGDGLFVFPRAAVDDSGVLHMIWGEPDYPPGNDTWGQWDITRLRYSYHDGARWSEQVELLARDEIQWGQNNRLVALDSAGRLHVIVEAGTQTGDETLVEMRHLTGGPDGWDVNRLETVDGMIYPSLVAGQNDSLYLSYVAGGGFGNPNSVYVAQSTDGGRTWRVGRRVYTSRGRKAFDVRLLRSGTGSLHLIWREDRSAPAVPTHGFRHTMSVDGGETWSELEDVAVADPIFSFDAVIDECGAIHVAYDVMKADANGELLVRLAYVRWHDGWIQPKPLFPKMVQAMNPGVGLDGEGNPILYFSGGRESETDSRGEVGGFLSRLDVRIAARR